MKEYDPITDAVFEWMLDRAASLPRTACAGELVVGHVLESVARAMEEIATVTKSTNAQAFYGLMAERIRSIKPE